MASLDIKLEALLIKYKDLKEAFRAYKDENSLEHKKRVDEILSVMKMPGQKGDKGDKGEQGERGKDGVDGKDGKDGEDGATIVSSWIAADNHLMFEMSDGRQIDAGDLMIDGNGGVGNTFVTQKSIQDATVINQYTQVKEEGVLVEDETLIFNFVGDAVQATSLAGEVTVTVDAPTQTEFDGLSSNVTSNTANISSNTSNISALDGRVTTVENDLNALEASFSSLGNGDAPSGVRTTSAADQTLTNETFTTLLFTVTTTNTEPSNYSVAGTGRITVQESGFYSLTAGVVIQASAVSAIESSALGIFRNGELVSFQSNDTTVQVNQTNSITCGTNIFLTAGDIIDTRARVVSVGGVGNGLAARLALLFGQTATQVNHLSIVKFK